MGWSSSALTGPCAPPTVIVVLPLFCLRRKFLESLYFQSAGTSTIFSSAFLS